MAQYDGSIRIKTEIESKQAKVQLSALENRMVKTADKIDSLRSKMDSLKDVKIPTQEYKDLQKELELLSAKTKDIENVPTKGYEKLQDSIKNSKLRLEEFENEQKKLFESGIGKDYDKDLSYLAAYENVKKFKSELQKAIDIGDQDAYMGIEDSLNRAKSVLESMMSKEQRPLGDISYYFQIEKKISDLKGEISGAESEMKKLEESGKAFSINENTQKIENLKAKMKELEQSGKAFTLGSDTEEYAKLGQQLGYAESEMDVMNQKHDILENKIGKSSDGYKKLGETAKQAFGKINKHAEKTGGFLSTLGSRFRGLALSLLIFNQINKAFNAMISGMKAGFQNFYNENNRFKSQIDSLKASMLTLQNSFAAAFAPLVQAVIPYIQKAIQWIVSLMNLIGQFIAALTGQKTYTKAVKQTTAAVKENTKAQAKQNKQLSNLDKLNNLTSQGDSGGGGAGGGAGQMFEEVPIDSKILDFLKKLEDYLKPVINYAKQLKDIFKKGFFDGLGDWESRFSSIKSSIASIKSSLKDIFTDPAVLASADKWVKSVVYLLGSIVGSVASIGLTIATNIVGGISKYLEQNKDLIKQRLISMFDIWSDINQKFSEFFQSLAFIFEAFASENGQQLTANIIGIFADAFMYVIELASKLFRDIVNIIIQPFVDNKEAFRTALEDFLGVLSEVTGTIKQGIDETFAKLNEVYDEHFKPFFDSIANGLSDTVEKFLEFWNGNIQPILDEWAQDFDTLWKEHIQPMLNKFMNLLGDVADLLKTVWETILKPLIDWIIENILPVISPILKGVGKAVMKVFGTISDVVGNILDALSGVIEFLTGVFSGDWKKAWNGIVKIFKGIFNLIPSIIEGILNVAISIINGLIGGINKLTGAVGIPSIPSIPDVHLPRLATGTVVPPNREFLAVLGDNKKEPEVVSPISTMKQAVMEAIAESGITSGGGNDYGDIVVMIDGREVFRAVRKQSVEYKKQTGKPAFS